MPAPPCSGYSNCATALSTSSYVFTLCPESALLLARFALEIGGVIGVSRAFVFRNLWIGTERTGKLCALLGIQIGSIFCSDNLVRRGPFLHPLFQRGIDVVLRVRSGPRLLAKGVRPRSPAAVLHSRYQIKAQKN